jgi:ribokinase
MAERAGVVVVGSANLDLVVRCGQIPSPGETVLGSEFMTVPGGKGANQAVAAARLGAPVTFVGRVGKDAFGDRLAAEIGGAGVDTTYLVRDADHATGVALISVDQAGQNAIVVAPGANGALSPADVDAAEAVIASAAVLIVQLEIPLDTVKHAIAVAKRHGTRTILNPAPVRSANPPGAALLTEVDVLTPNEHEAANLLGHSSPDGLDMTTVARRLVDRGPGLVIVTLGASGCLVAWRGSEMHVTAPKVTAVDTTAAGDCFTGALAVGLAEGMELGGAVQFAVRAASISVTRAGAQPSLPTRAEVAM